MSIVDGLVVLYLLSPVITSLQNSDPIFTGGVFRPGAGLYDGVSELLSRLMILIAYFIGRSRFQSAESFKEILIVLSASALIYSFPIMVELQLSPQLHRWVYGYHPHSFEQQVRDGGYRAVVFIGHGLFVSLFIATALVALTALWRTRTRVFGVPSGPAAAYLAGVLILCKTLGALVLGAASTLVMLSARPRLQMRVAVLLVSVALTYPAARATNAFPTNEIVSIAAAYSPERAASLQFRFDQEQLLLERAWTRFWFGWGRYGRSRVYEEGKDVSTTDGLWIITFGSFGCLGFLAEFGLLAGCVFSAAAAAKRCATKAEALHLAAVTLIMSVIIVDQLPNSSLSPWSFLLAGSLIGRSKALRAERLAAARPLADHLTDASTAFGNMSRKRRTSLFSSPEPRRPETI